MMRRALPFLLTTLLLVLTAAHAQSPSVTQAGPIVPGHIVCFSGTAFPQQIYDCGPGGGALGIGQTSVIGPPSSNGGLLYNNNGVLGVQANSGPGTPSATSLSVGTTSVSGGASGNFLYEFGGSGTNFTLGSLSSTQFAALFCINASGSVIPVSTGNCNAVTPSVTGPASSTIGNVPSFGDTAGSILQDSGVPSTSIVKGPPSSAAGDIVTFNGTTGKIVADSAIPASVVLSWTSNIATLRQLTSAQPNPSIWVRGYYGPGDGGEGMFTYFPTDTSSDNGGTIIVDAVGRHWHRAAAVSNSYNIAWFGCLETTPDCAPALINAVDALAANTTSGGTIFFPKGVHTFLSPATIFYPTRRFSYTIVGEGDEATILNWPSTSGLALRASNPAHSFHMRDLTVTSGAVNAGVGLSLVNTVQGGGIEQSDITRVTFRGFDGPAASDSWATAIGVAGLGFINFDTVLIYGNGANTANGISLQGIAGGGFQYGIVYNLAKCGFFNLGNGLIYGTLVQGVSVSQSNFTNDVTGILVPLGVVGAAQLAVNNSQIQTTGNDIVVLSAFGGLILTGNLFYVATNSTAILLNGAGGDQTVIVGNDFSGNPGSTGGTAINVLATNSGVVTGNQFLGVTNGLNLSGSPFNWNVSQNVYINVTNQVLNPGSNAVGIATK